MSFKEQYTTSELVTKESSLDLKSLPKEYKLESEKTLLSNDAYAIGQMLELLINRMVK